MRLFISSYRAGDHDRDLIHFLRGVKKIAVITNAKDYKSEEGRENKVAENFEYYRSIGLQPTEIDLRPYFHKPGAQKLLKGFEFIWFAGGNVFLLRRALYYTELDKWLIQQTKSNKIILGGESAGAIIMGPTLKYSEVDTDEDSPEYIPNGYEKAAIWEGLNLINYVPVPHYKTPGYTGIEEYVQHLEKEKIPHKKMTDSQAIIVDRTKTEFLK